MSSLLSSGILNTRVVRNHASRVHTKAAGVPHTIHCRKVMRTSANS